LSLALERTLPLATLDRRLAAAARAEGVEILGPLVNG
ncbi:VapC toxin family PIN domain ribonuclease, partial [Mesorhizobium sp. M2A.F.Ca.ET.040.01.1.1]